MGIAMSASGEESSIFLGFVGVIFFDLSGSLREQFLRKFRKNKGCFFFPNSSGSPII
jgi:hypothetical protein